jgi:hypothetical protein
MAFNINHSLIFSFLCLFMYIVACIFLLGLYWFFYPVLASAFLYGHWVFICTKLNLHFRCTILNKLNVWDPLHYFLHYFKMLII